MGGFFGVASTSECTTDLFFGTDYHSHLGTKRGGLAVRNGSALRNVIHSIENAPFRTKFEDDLDKLEGNTGIGVISDYDDQPLIVASHLGNYAIVTVGRINNTQELTKRALSKGAHFLEMSGGDINPTELVATLINEGDNFTNGIRQAQELIDGSCSMMLLTEEGIYLARDRYGRTPIIVGKKDGAWAATFETCAFPNLGYDYERDLGPAEIALMTADGVEQKAEPGEAMRICSFLWIYYGYPASTYEGINVEEARYRNGAALSEGDDVDPDMVAGIPDSGVGHALGYAMESGIPYRRPFVKYTPTWPRSFMPQNQKHRDLVARMKLIPIKEMIKNKKLLFSDDSIVRGTQLQDQVRRLFEADAEEVHMRVSCPPLAFGCKYLNFSRSKSELDLAARRAVKELENGDDSKDLDQYSDCSTCKYQQMIEVIRERLGLTSLKYQALDKMVDAIGLPREKLCTYCWTGEE